MKNQQALNDAIIMISLRRFHWRASIYFCEQCFINIDEGNFPALSDMTIAAGSQEFRAGVPIGHCLQAFQLGHPLSFPDGDTYDRGEVARWGVQHFLAGALITYVHSALDRQKIKKNYFQELWEAFPVFHFLSLARHCVAHAEWSMTGVSGNRRAEWKGIVIEKSDRELVLDNEHCLDLVNEILAHLINFHLKNGGDLDWATCFYTADLPEVHQHLQALPEKRRAVEGFWGCPLP